ncbi:MAG: hypothetical protein R3C05_12685 [Pirellulaceae bacterium]
MNHRLGLTDGFTYSDYNHLALADRSTEQPAMESLPAKRPLKAKRWAGGIAEGMKAPTIVEVEVDTWSSSLKSYPLSPHIILLITSR